MLLNNCLAQTETLQELKVFLIGRYKLHFLNPALSVLLATLAKLSTP